MGKASSGARASTGDRDSDKKQQKPLRAGPVETAKPQTVENEKPV